MPVSFVKYFIEESISYGKDDAKTAGFNAFYPDDYAGYGVFPAADSFATREAIIGVADYSFYAVIVYLLIIFCIPPLLKEYEIPPWRPKYLIAAWNFMLAVFSIVGSSICVPNYIWLLLNAGWHNAICVDRSGWVGYNGIYAFAFIVSKNFDLVDTMWLVAGQRNIIFLHWYHHASVVLYCLQTATSMAAITSLHGIMNYFVHSLMYTYYFFSQLKHDCPVFSYLYPYRSILTILQTLQMFIGFGAIIYVYILGDECPASHSETINYGMIVYSSYALLFVKFFVDNYIRKKKSKKQKSKRR